VASIRKSIDVPGVRSEVAAAWAGFIDSVLVGRRRLACDELTCVDPVAAELVGFEDLGDGRTRVNVTLPVIGDDPVTDLDLIGHKLSHDLVLFLDYVESGEYRREHVPDAVGSSALKEDVRKGRFARHDARPDVDSLSVRGSGRA
jgi:hypothetical protein